MSNLEYNKTVDVIQKRLTHLIAQNNLVMNMLTRMERRIDTMGSIIANNGIANNKNINSVKEELSEIKFKIRNISSQKSVSSLGVQIQRLISYEGLGSYDCLSDASTVGVDLLSD